MKHPQVAQVELKRCRCGLLRGLWEREAWRERVGVGVLGELGMQSHRKPGTHQRTKATGTFAAATRDTTDQFHTIICAGKVASLSTVARDVLGCKACAGAAGHRTTWRQEPLGLSYAGKGMHGIKQVWGQVQEGRGQAHLQARLR